MGCERTSNESIEVALSSLQENIHQEQSNLMAIEKRFAEQIACLESTVREVQEQLQNRIVAADEANAAANTSSVELEARCTSEAAAAIAAAGRATSFVESEVARLQYVVDSLGRRNEEASGQLRKDALEAAQSVCDGLREEFGSELAAELAASKE